MSSFFCSRGVGSKVPVLTPAVAVATSPITNGISRLKSGSFQVYGLSQGAVDRVGRNGKLRIPGFL